MAKYLSANAGTEVPESLFFVDTETTRSYPKSGGTNFHEKFRLGVVTHVILRENRVVSRESYTFYDPKHFWNFLYFRINMRKSNWIFAHNLAFDLQTLNIFDRVLSRELIISEQPGDFQIGQPYEEKKRPWRGMAVIDSLPCFIRCRARRGTLVFCDTLNYFPKPLLIIGEEIGIPKMQFPGEFGTKEQWETYCRNDVAIIESLMVETMISWKSAAAGNWNYTAPGLCWNNFRHDHAPKIIRKGKRESCNIVIHDNADAKLLERDSYHGGQMSCFFYGYVSPEKDQFSDRPWSSETLYHLDCRSLFPYCMSLAKYPVSLQKYYQKGTLALLEHYARSAGVIAEVELDTPEIPFIVSHQKEIRYATGKFWTTLCADELGRALEEGLIRRVGSMAVYQIGDLFSGYVKHWYGEREKAKSENKPHREAFAKLMLNSLYGKFGQKSPRWIDDTSGAVSMDFGLAYHMGLNDTKIRQIRAFAGHIQEKVEPADAKNSFCAISSFVTANAREYMRTIRELCPLYSVYYQHTDSLICTVAAYECIKKHGLIGTAIGQFREVAEPAQTAEFYGVGDYEFGAKVVQSGRKSSAKIIDPETITQDNYHGLALVIAQGNQGGVVGQSVTLHRSRDRWKKHASDTGWALPLVIQSDLPQRLEQQQLSPSQPLFGPSFREPF